MPKERENQVGIFSVVDLIISRIDPEDPEVGFSRFADFVCDNFLLFFSKRKKSVIKCIEASENFTLTDDTMQKLYILKMALAQ